MAKRRKLEAPDAAELAALEEGFAAKPVPDRFGITVPPIASVVAEAARLSEPGTPEQRVKAARDASDAGAWREAVEQGRIVENLPLAAIALDHIVRDRMSVSREEMEELKASLRASGQRLPVEVVPVGGGRYGLISGWRRVTALRELAEHGGVQTVQAIIRGADDSGSAYAAMVEENEVRAALTPYERGRIAVIAAEQGAFRAPEEAVDAIFAAASKAKRSKIRSFALVHEELGDLLAFPTDLSERNGLRLAQAIRNGLGPELREALGSGMGADAAQEWALLEPVVQQGDVPVKPERGGRPKREKPPSARESLANGITLECQRLDDGFTLRLRGRNADSQLMSLLAEEIRRLLEPI
ncbi:chromosome partitioning protein ParB [Haematobacter missouriensis]|uniref:Chromosome partitioning protein ParB n=1 Tax=Haematobacter missouriensis TaxID=366616 RepID=A0A212AMX8_9RHOB|nr:ParB N-terminal domain-containing protein [Haematobacter missouriensis]KFI25347.1 chromosome partitioning protein ParB [Haematobacter missouriensis]OWJ74456.1 chromosome partitioning protein ParB [Haematobacter missouriensis]OWJ82864.1 chromosome partitioning protein ParB [Haematobacter missouriensis]